MRKQSIAWISPLFFLLVSVLISIIVLWPIIWHPASRIADDSDGLLGAWTIYTVQENILYGRPLLEGNIFFPHKNTVLFSDVFITSTIFTLPVRLFSQEPLMPYSVSIIFALIGTLFFSHLFFVQLLKFAGRENNLLSFTVACIFSLSQIHMHYIGHLHMFSLQFVVASMWAILVFIEKKKGTWLYMVAFFCVLQVWQSFFLVYYVVFFSAFLLLLPSVRKVFLEKKNVIFFALILFLLGSLPLGLQYVQFFRTYHVVRDIREAIHFSLLFKDLGEHFLSPVAYVFLFTSFLLFLQRSFRDSFSRVLVVLGLFFFVLSLGPALHIGADTVKIPFAGHTLHVPLPYTLFYYLAPGFQAFRTPSRFMPAALLFFLASGAVVMSKTKWVRTYSLPLSILCIGASILLIVPVFTFHVPTTTEYPASVSFLSSRPEHVLVKLPLRDWGDPHAKEDVYEMLYSLMYRKKLVNGQSGFFPNEWLSFQHEIIMTFPSVRATELLAKRGVELFLIEKRWYPALRARDLPAYKLHLEYEDSGVYITSILPTLLQ